MKISKKTQKFSNKNNKLNLKKCLNTMKSLNLIYPKKQKNANIQSYVGVSLKTFEKSTSSSLSTFASIKGISPFRNDRCHTFENDSIKTNQSASNFKKATNYLGHNSMSNHINFVGSFSSLHKKNHFISKIKITKIQKLFPQNLSTVQNKEDTQSFHSLNEIENDNFEPLSPKASKIPLFNIQKLNSNILSFNITEFLLNSKMTINIFKFLSIKDCFSFSISSKENFKNIYKYLIIRILPSIGFNPHTEKVIWHKIYTKSTLSKYKNETIMFLYTQNLLKRNLLTFNQENKIKLDLERTFPHEESFKKGKDNYNKLYNLLKAYSSYHEKLGYVQGMNFIAATILAKYKIEIDSFICLDGLISYFHFDKLLTDDNLDYYYIIMKELDGILKNCRTIEHLKMNNISYECFTSGWIFTLFTNAIDKKEFIYIIWDLTFLIGWKFLYCFIYAIFDFFKEDVKIVPINQIVLQIKNFCKSVDFKINFFKVINSAIDVYTSLI